MAFRILLGDQFWVDCLLPFGLRTAPFLFGLVANGLHWVMAANPDFAVPDFAILHYLDDFLAIGPQSTDVVAYDCSFASACKRLGFQIKTEKSTTGTITDFCGLEIDTHSMQARLPLPKLEKARELVASAIRQKIAFAHGTTFSRRVSLFLHQGCSHQARLPPPALYSVVRVPHTVDDGSHQTQ